MTNYFLKQPQARFDTRSAGVFVGAACAAWVVNILGQVTFPSFNLAPYLIRTTITLIADVFLLVISLRLLQQNKISPGALGLSLTKDIFVNLLLGLLIGIVTLALMEALFYAGEPFHFEQGRLPAIDAVKESVSFLLGNTLEELMFRGFLLVVLSRFAGWRTSVLAMAIPFGLFHLPGLGISVGGLKMVATTAAYSLVFSLSFILTRSMWTAISAHVTSNMLLHTLLGLDGMQQAMFLPVHPGRGLGYRDFGSGFMIISALTMSSLLYLIVSDKFKKESLMQDEPGAVVDSPTR